MTQEYSDIRTHILRQLKNQPLDGEDVCACHYNYLKKGLEQAGYSEEVVQRMPELLRELVDEGLVTKIAIQGLNERGEYQTIPICFGYILNEAHVAHLIQDTPFRKIFRKTGLAASASRDTPFREIFRKTESVVSASRKS